MVRAEGVYDRAEGMYSRDGGMWAMAAMFFCTGAVTFGAGGPPAGLAPMGGGRFGGRGQGCERAPGPR